MKRRRWLAMVLLTLPAFLCFILLSKPAQNTFSDAPLTFVRAGTQVQYKRWTPAGPSRSSENVEVIYRVPGSLSQLMLTAAPELRQLGYSETEKSSHEVRFERVDGKYVTLQERATYVTVHVYSYVPLPRIDRFRQWVDEAF